MTQVKVQPASNVVVVVDRSAQGPTGPAGTNGTAGPTGPTGATGQGLQLQGVVATPADLPPTGTAGEAYYVTSTASVYIWSN